MYSYEVASEEVYVGVPSVVKGRVDRTDHPWETFRDQPRIGPTFPIRPENLVALAVVPPELSACTEKKQKSNIHLQNIFRQINPVTVNCCTNYDQLYLFLRPCL